MKQTNFVTSLVMVIFNYYPNIREITKAISNGSLDYVILIDNSNEKNHNMSAILNSFGAYKNRVIYTENHANLGLSRALNIGIREGMRVGTNLFFILDQDTSVIDTYFDEMKSIFRDIVERKESLGAIGPIVSNSHLFLGQNCGLRSRVSRVRMLINSGMVIPLTTFLKIGFYNENLFLDSIDTDFVNRMMLSGLSIYRYNKIMLCQNFGKTIHGDTIIIKCFESMFKILSLILIALGKSNIFYSHINYYPKTRRSNIESDTNLINKRHRFMKISNFIFVYLIDFLLNKLLIEVSYE